MAILNGAKEAILDGDRHVYDSRPYMCCSLNLPVEAGAPKASPNDPLLGVYIALDPRVMTELTMEIESIGGIDAMSAGGAVVRGLALAGWSPDFTEAITPHSVGRQSIRHCDFRENPSPGSLLCSLSSWSG